MESAVLQSYLEDSLHILTASLEQVENGAAPFYRVVALQLRLLLCDSSRRHNHLEDTSLAEQLFPDLALPALAPPHAPLPLAQWLEQPAAAGLTVRQLIRRVCDQDGGAHVDPHPQAGLPDLPPQQIQAAIYRLGQLTAQSLRQRLG